MPTTHVTKILLVSLLTLSASCGGPAETEPPAVAEDTSPAPRLPFTSAVRVGNTHYFSGWGSRDPETGRHPEGFEAQVRQLMLNLQRLLQRQGVSFDQVVHTHSYITYPDHFDEFYRIYAEYFESPAPALTTVEVPRLPATEVEITFIASHAGEPQVVVPEGATEGSHFSYGVSDGEFLYVSGADSRDLRTGRLPDGDFRDHVRQCLENLGAVLEAAGLSYRDAVKTEVFLTDLDHFEAMNEVYRGFFSEEPPTRTTLGVTRLPGGAPIVVNVVAAHGPKQVVVPAGVEPSPNFSPGVRVGDRLFVSGKIGTVAGGVAPQVREVMDGLAPILQAAGMDFSNVVEAKVYLADMEDYAAMNEAYGAYFDGHFPSRSCIQAGSLLRDSKVEITLTADASPRL